MERTLKQPDPTPQGPPKFQDLPHAFLEFQQRALSELTPTNVVNVTRAGFFAGAQAALILLQEAVNRTPADVSDEDAGKAGLSAFNDLWAQVTAYFMVAQSQAETRGGR